MLKYTFDNSQGSFFKQLKKKVDQYFTDNRIHPAGNSKIYFKGILLVLSAVALYSTLVFFTPHVLISILLCIVLGINLAAIGFNVMHEGGHQTFSKYPLINMVSAYFLNVLGGNIYYWKIKHNINHHTYTNIEGMDSDIDVKPFMRLHEGQPRKSYHRYQHIYWVLLYGVSYLAWVFYDDFQKYFTGKVGPNSEKKKLASKEHFIFWVTKIMFVFTYMVVPILIVGWLSWLIGFLIITFVCGLTTSIVFQLAHVVEGTQFQSALLEEGKKKPEWAIHQILSTANFATSNKFLYWLLGGLNFQVEHHLFPKISHIHYPALNRFVKEACRESNVVYKEYSSMLKAFGSHLMHLRRLGRA